MKGIDFIEVMGEIDESFIQEIDTIREKKIIVFSYKKVMSYAASLLLICTLSISGYRYFINPTGTSHDATGISMEDMNRGVENSPSTLNMLDEAGDETGIAAEDEETIIGGVDGPTNIYVQEETKKNIFEKIFDKIVSFFDELRS